MMNGSQCNNQKSKYVMMKASSEVVEYVADIFYDSVAEEKIPIGIPTTDELKVYSFEEFLLLAKEQPGKYREEYIKWLYPYIQRYADSAIRCHPLEMMDHLIVRLNRAADEALEVYQPHRGDFFHLLSKIMKTSLRGTELDYFQFFHRREKYLGTRISYTNSPEFYDVAVESRQEDVIAKVDFDDYLKELTPKEQKILKLKILGYGPKEIANASGIPYTTVFYHLTTVYEGFLKKCTKAK